MPVSFAKMHGLGNDFVVVDATTTPFRPQPDQAAWIADRRRGVGCDQILVLEPAPTAAADFGYRIFNADGSESGQCGNGARCMALFIRDRGLSSKDTIRVHTSGGVLALEHLPGGQVRVAMGIPRLAPAEIPFAAPEQLPRYRVAGENGPALEFGAVSVGNPHAVIFVPDVATASVAEIGAALQARGVFPEGVNVGFLQVLDSQSARLRVFERGVGETQACGSGACAAAIVGQVWGALGQSVVVELTGGRLKIEWQGSGSQVFMTGPAEKVFEGEFEWPSRNKSTQ